MNTVASNAELELAEQIQGFYGDPLGYVLFAFPWRERGGPLENFSGPNRHQERFLIDLGDEIVARKFDGIHAVPPIRMSTSSGHGTGKSAEVGFLASFLMSTRNGLQGTITANTGQQLNTKTWASIQTWNQRSITRHWFEITSERFWRINRKADWFFSAQTCAEENSEAFAGQHALQSSSVYIFDEDSNVPDKIHEVAEGGLVHGESMFFLFGNPTRRSGKFYQINFGADKDFWNRCTLGPTKDTEEPAGTRVWNAEDSDFANKAQQAERREQYGEDSDFYRVRVKGLPPGSDDLQFIDSERVYASQRREVLAMDDDPLIVGVDVARGGSARNCIYFRCGLDARSIPAQIIPGSKTRDTMVLVSRLAEVLTKKYVVNGIQRPVAMMFVDAGFGGAAVNRLHEMGFKNVSEINFGGESLDPHYLNTRSYIWGRAKEWLMLGAIPTTKTEIGRLLEADLVAPGFKHNKSDKVVLESKEEMLARDVASPDVGDGFCLTFARSVAPIGMKTRGQLIRGQQMQVPVTAYS